MLTTIQIFLLIFIAFFLSRVFLRSREKVISAKTSLFWTIVWIIALIGILLPATTSKIATLVGVGRGVDVIIYLALSLLFYLVFRLYVMIEDIRREITSLVREIALSNIKKKNKPRTRKQSGEK